MSSSSGSSSDDTILAKEEPEDNLPLGFAPQSPPKRSCISNACQPCRKRKTKCDGAKPVCNSCSSVHNTAGDCVYDLLLDLRRKDAMMQKIRDLKGQLEDQDTILSAIGNGSEVVADKIVEWLRGNPNEPLELLADCIKTDSMGPAETTDPQTLEKELALEELDFDKISTWWVEQVQSWTTVTYDGEFIMHLLQLYFIHSHSFYVLFSDELFWHGLNNMKLKYCSPALLNAVLALACNFSDRPEARANPDDPATVGNHFFIEAKRFLDEPHRTCVTHVQALGVMSLRQAINNNDDSCWEYRGRMMSMSVRLGLHMRYTGPKNGNTTVTEVEFRRITFWGCYVLETALALCYRCVSSLPSSAVRLSKPNPIEDLKQNIWKTYSHEDSGLEHPNITITLLHHSSFLSDIVNDIVQLFYVQRSGVTNTKLLSYYERLREWHGNLPEILTVKQGGSTLPQVLTLHMYYHHCVIRLFLPYVRSTTFTVKGTHSPRQVCLEEAIAVFRLMMKYSSSYGLRRGYLITTHCIAVSAMIHLLHMTSLERSLIIAVQAAELLLETVKMMREMETTFPIVARHLKMFRKQASAWGIKLPERVRLALEPADVSSPPLTSPAVSCAALSPSPAVDEAMAMEVENHVDDSESPFAEDGLHDSASIDLGDFFNFE